MAQTSKTIRVALAQMNSCVGAFDQNAQRMLEFTGKALSEGAQLVLFPELALSSYPCLDLLDRQDYRDEHASVLEKFIAALKGAQGNATVIFGAFTPNPGNKGRLLQNSALVVAGGKIVYSQGKQLLPSYDVFDENRYFEPAPSASPYKSPLGPLAISICEDAWFEELHTGRSLYDHDPAHALTGAFLAVNISASPYGLGKQARRDQCVSGFARRVMAPLLYVNQVGVNDEILFDGDSRILNEKGEKLVVAPSFLEGLLVCDLDLGTSTKASDPKFFMPEGKILQPVTTWQNAPALLTMSAAVIWSKDPRTTPPPGRLQLVADVHVAPAPTKAPVGRLTTDADPKRELRLLARGLEAGISDYFQKTGFTKAIIGLSGGIDSAVVATLAARALGPENVYGLSMFSKYSSTGSLVDAEALADNLGIQYGAASIKFVQAALQMELKSHFRGAPEDETEENLQSRLRGVILMAIANKHKSLVLTTGNKSELAVGYCTLYGDMCGALAPLGDLYKTKVYALARYLNEEGAVIPESSITKPPSAELRPGQTDQDNLPPYDVLDGILQAHIEEGQGAQQLATRGYDPQIIAKVLRLVKITEFKRRQAAPSLKVTPKAFGLGRRYPVVRGF